MCAWGWRITAGSTRACSPPPTPPRSPASARSSKASASRSPHPPRPAKSSRSREATMSDSDLRTPPALEHFRVEIDEDGIAHLIRSEEHTSELQSLMRISYAVFCLKKKKTTQNTETDT